MSKRTHTDKAYMRVTKAAWREKNRLHDRAVAAARRYNISPELFKKLHEQQQGKCAIPACANPAECLDHDHSLEGETAVRGLLCHDCNKALGMLRDDFNRVWWILQYLRRHRRMLSLNLQW
jgi:hypothetical protein